MAESSSHLAEQSQESRKDYLDYLGEVCVFFEDSLSFMQTGRLDSASFNAMKLKATGLSDSGRRSGYICISHAADLLLIMLNHLADFYGDDITLPVEEQEHLAVLTLAVLVIIRKVSTGEIVPEMKSHSSPLPLTSGMGHQ